MKLEARKTEKKIKNVSIIFVEETKYKVITEDYRRSQKSNFLYLYFCGITQCKEGDHVTENCKLATDDVKVIRKPENQTMRSNGEPSKFQ